MSPASTRNWVYPGMTPSQQPPVQHNVVAAVGNGNGTQKEHMGPWAHCSSVGKILSAEDNALTRALTW